MITINEFITPPNHFGFKAKKITGKIKGKITNCSIAYIEPQGGGPKPSHTHLHAHFFIVIEGTATIKMNEKKIKLDINESILVPGVEDHSIWNETDKPLKMLGITIHDENL